MVSLVKRCWRDLFDLRIINKTCISLITLAKKCNVIYKILSKTNSKQIKRDFRALVISHLFFADENILFAKTII